ncbi:putative NADPH quinone oxidoreductase [Bradyrhizobium sp. ORS 375]|uniref:alcohol dehydrogenase catalytic domain-containing protein n=1 Tax=Bradyrhizobium sp. (strain ORS 375) TaxID=566679 RepID=UPI0002406F61|nr:zinc-binding dehydrogenase [Bradyrhizobium sp. ORS 375]CCD95115.1 putative NADPH quinone oxidoreductase [Bradyrhizobium sp. ORS 375]
MTTSMNAAILHEAGAPLRIAPISRPTPGQGEVLVRIAAAGTNPLDAKIHAGQAAHARHPAPAILGLDMAGTVEAVGPGVTRFRPGDDVYGMVGGVGGHPGTLAEYVSADEDLLAAKPANLTMREAAVLPLVTITAWEGLVDRVGIRHGQTLLVLGGAGGVGHIVVQLGLAFGATVYATGSAESTAVIERLGATFIDRNEPIAEAVARTTAGRGFDVVYDTVGALDVAFAAVARFGHVTSSLGWGTHPLAPLSFKGGTYSGVFTLLPLLDGQGRRHHGEILAQAAQLVEAGKLMPLLDPRRFALEDVSAAYDALRRGDGTGKIAVDIAPV